LQSNLLHNISTLLLGEPGIGKSYLVKSLTDSQTRPVLWIENLKAVRSVLIESIISTLHQDRNLKLDDDNYSLSLTLEEIKSKCLKNKTIEQLAEIISDSVIGKNYICVINSMTGLTIANQVIIDKILLAGVPVFACTNRLKPTVELESIYRRFNQLELQPMKNKYIREITTNKLVNVRADETNKQILITRITNSACGNVGIVEKMTKDALALSTGGDLTYDQVYAIQEPYLHRKYFDLTPIVLLSIASFAVLRFIGLGTNDTLLYIIGGIAFIVFMAVSRLLLKTWGS
jgi:GTPase SAR1 family protein